MSKFNANSTKGLSVGDRVTLSDADGDTTTFTVVKIKDSYTLENKTGTVFKIAHSGWTVSGVEFIMPDKDGLYASKNANITIMVQRIQGAWFGSDGKENLSDDDLLDLMPLFRLVGVNENLDQVVRTLKGLDAYKHSNYNERETFDKKYIDPLVQNLQER